MASSDRISEKHLVLKPEEASLLDLFRILFSGNFKKKDFIKCLKKEEAILERRWIIFISVLVQKTLLYMEKPLSWFGYRFEQLLNLLSSHSNFGVLLLSLITRRVVIPDKESATFMSTIGHLDKRVELDSSIKPGDSRYYGALCAMASKIAYENKAFIKTTVEDRWKMKFLGAYDFWDEYLQRSSTQGFIFEDQSVDPNMIVVAFRGTEYFDADSWCTDFDISWYKLQGIGKIHGGFMKALGLQKNQTWPQNVEQDKDRPLAYYTIREKLREFFMVNTRAKLIVTGHSLGGALAVLFPALLALHKEKLILERLEGIYTFGQPRVGDNKFGKFMKEQLGVYGARYYRFVYSLDIVPRLPYDDSALVFKHFGTCLYYNCLYEGKIVKEEPYKNYFSLLSFITKRLIALWELIRGFIIPYTRGPDYRESLLLQMVRLFGIIFPGLPAHSPQDYINATRLGSADIFQCVETQHLEEVSQIREYNSDISEDCTDTEIL